MADIFGNVHLGYIVIETEKFADWRRFGRDAIGMHVDETLPDVMRFRLDDNECRFLLQRGPAEDVTALGWQLDDHSTFDEIVSRVTRHGVPVTEGTAEEAALRGVERLVRFPGPNGLAQESLHPRPCQRCAAGHGGSAAASSPGNPGWDTSRSRRRKPHQMRGYYNTVFDARLSDYIDETISGLKLKIRFLRVNQRHHSVAIAAVNRLPVNPIRTRVQHLNIQVADLDDMTASYQRVKELGFDMALGVGQHTNDKELSYYAMTPSGFEWEVGWNPIVVDENTWEPTDLSGHQHLGSHPGGSDHHRQTRPVQDRRAVAGAPRRHRARRWPARHPGITDGAHMLRIDTHHHMIPPDYRKALRRSAGSTKPADGPYPTGARRGRCRPWPNSTSPPPSCRCRPRARPSCRVRRRRGAGARPQRLRRRPGGRPPDRFGLFATVPMPHLDESVAETVRALDDLNADGVVLLANNDGTYLGQDGQDDAVRRARRARGGRLHPSRRPSRPDGARCRAVRRQTSCSTPPAPHTYWCATVFAANIRTSASS